ncbi:MAG: helix-turn-helix domain-containing protein [Myxococcales bacterium]|nr:helix-turn-helix domain-containing protein [Myxococcales bacterium]HQY63188.1 helix-turn-helix domain-containing protein [Polyangiaceae bacterium]
MGAERRTVDALVAAADEEVAAESAMELLTASFAAVGAGITFWRGGQFAGQRWAALPAKFEADYVATFHAGDPWKEESQRVPTGKLVASDHLLPRAELERTSFYNELCRPHAIGDLCGGVLLRRGDDLVTFGMLRAADAKGSGAREVKDLLALRPALTRLATRELGRRDVRVAGLAVDSLSFGVLVLDATTGALLTANGPGLRLLERGVICRTGGRTHVGGRDLTALLVEGRPRALAIAPGLRVVVHAAAPYGHGRACVVHAHHLRSMARERAARATALFALSPREADVAEALMLGWSTKEIAARDRVAISTLRTHLRSLLRKTGSDRLATLHALLSGL